MRRSDAQRAQGSVDEATELEVGDHRPVVAGLRHALEAGALVHHPRAVVGGHRERERLEAFLAGLHHAGAENRFADAFAAVQRHDGDRELGGLLVDEAVAGLGVGEQAVPGRATGSPSVSAITPPSPGRPQPW